MGPTDDLIEPLKRAAAEPPSDKAAYAAWIAQSDISQLLENDTQGDLVVVYASLPHAFIHTALVKEASVTPVDEDDLLSWGFHPSSSWGLSYSGAEPPEVTIEEPYESASSETLRGAEQLIFVRQFEGRSSSRSTSSSSRNLPMCLDCILSRSVTHIANLMSEAIWKISFE